MAIAAASPGSTRPRRTEGFTLLEVMVALAILGFGIAWMVEIWTNSMDKAGRAIDDRELREYAGAFFTKFIYEHNDGSPTDGTLREYGEWAKLSAAESDRLSRYRYTFSRLSKAPIGAGGDDSDPLFALGEEEDDGGGLVDSDSTREVGEGEGDAATSGPVVWELLLKVYDTKNASDDRDDKPIYVLKTYVPPSVPGE